MLPFYSNTSYGSLCKSISFAYVRVSTVTWLLSGNVIAKRSATSNFFGGRSCPACVQCGMSAVPLMRQSGSGPSGHFTTRRRSGSLGLRLRSSKYSVDESTEQTRNVVLRSSCKYKALRDELDMCPCMICKCETARCRCTLRPRLSDDLDKLQISAHLPERTAQIVSITVKIPSWLRKRNSH